MLLKPNAVNYPVGRVGLGVGQWPRPPPALGGQERPHEVPHSRSQLKLPLHCDHPWTSTTKQFWKHDIAIVEQRWETGGIESNARYQQLILLHCSRAQDDVERYSVQNPRNPKPWRTISESFFGLSNSRARTHPFTRDSSGPNWNGLRTGSQASIMTEVQRNIGKVRRVRTHYGTFQGNLPRFLRVISLRRTGVLPKSISKRVTHSEETLAIRPPWNITPRNEPELLNLNLNSTHYITAFNQTVDCVVIVPELCCNLQL